MGVCCYRHGPMLTRSRRGYISPLLICMVSALGMGVLALLGAAFRVK